MMMDYGQATAFIKEAGKVGISYGLSGIRSLMQKLGNVQEGLKCIHVAGTNGKGSVSAMLASILSEAGYHTGRYSSPAVFSNEETCQMDGVPISKDEYAYYAEKCKVACGELIEEGKPHPSAFEIETAMAFCFFADKQCDYVVIEAGMGGLEDATNLLSSPVCSVITSISRDHMKFLGDSLTEIALAKAGIIKPGCPVVCVPQKEEVRGVIKERAGQCGSRLAICNPMDIGQFTMEPPQGSSFFYRSPVERDFHGGQEEKYQIPLLGSFQRENVSCVLEVVSVLRESGINISNHALREGLSKVRLPGRMECIRKNPDFYIDGAHNQGAALELGRTVKACFSDRRIVYLIGMLADKEYEKVLAAMLPLAEEAYMITPDNPRALPADELAATAGKYFSEKKLHVSGELEEAVCSAIQTAGEQGMVLAFGSFTFMGKLKQVVGHVRQ